MRLPTILFMTAGLAALAAGSARAQINPADPSPAGSAGRAPAEAAPAAAVSEIVVTGTKLDRARDSIEPGLGASTYSMPSKFIDNLPGGTNNQLNQVILQAPGATQDSFGQLHIRGDHANLQYRLNNVILPEGLAVFGQTLSPRLARSVDLITGALPAQYGLRTAGIVNITTKSGFNNGGEVSVYGGSHGEIEPSFEYGGTSGSNSGFLSGSFLQNDLGIESPDASSTPLHDRTRQFQLFGYADHIIDDSSRITLIGGTSISDFQIPNRQGVHPDLGLVVNGQSDFLSDDLDERQHESTSYAIASYLRTTDKLTTQASLFARYSALTFRPDDLGDLLFDGIAQDADKKDFAAGLQLESVYDLNDAHTLRGGIIIQGDRATSDTASQVLPVDVSGAQTSDIPLSILDNSAKTSWTYSAFVQDEWKLLDSLTLNYGLRFDQADSFRSEHQFSPRVNLVWIPVSGTTFHIGYSRYFTPPPTELVATESVAKFAGTTAAPPSTQDTAPFAERSNYFDLGVQQHIGALMVGVDGYYKKVHDLLDEGQFGAPIILTPFNYEDGKVYGVEFTANYSRGPFSIYGSFAISKAQGRNIVSSQFNFDPADLVYISNHFIPLDHDQRYTASGGASYRLGATNFNADLIYGSGLRRDGATPNGDKLPPYAQVNLSVSHNFADAPFGPIEVRLDVVNALDHVYEIRDGSGIGVGAPQFGARRGVFVGLTKSF
jgi:outer membrane receptor protein involved in Fe transport